MRCPDDFNPRGDFFTLGMLRSSISRTIYERDFNIEDFTPMSLKYNSGGDPQIVPQKPTITHYHPVSNTLSFVDLLLPAGLTIKDIRIFTSDGRRSVAPPSRSFQDRSGETRYVWLLDFATPELQREFQSEVLAAVDRFVGVEVRDAR